MKHVLKLIIQLRFKQPIASPRHQNHRVDHHRMLSHSIVPNLAEKDINSAEFEIRCAPQSVCQVPSSSFFISSSNDFLIINKPPDVRMNGDFNISVEKIILFQRPDLTASDLKWVHRLDFATSGALCVGLTRESAKFGAQSFADRKTKKVYVAVLDGILDPYQFPVLTESTPYQDVRKRKKGSDNMCGYTSSSEIVTKTWQDEARDNSISVCISALKDLSEKSVQEDPLVLELLSFDVNYFRRSSKARKLLRKVLRKHGIDVDLPPSEMSNYTEAGDEELQMRNALKAQHVKTAQDKPSAISNMTSDETPLIFRTSMEYNAPLIVRVPVLEVENEFRVFPGTSANPGRPCETSVEILETCTYMGRPVTKVKFTPVTGRRHQLRLHSFCLGHPIVGDATYDKDYDPRCARMMLHAHSLSIEFDKAFRGVEENTMRVETDDPFLIEDGRLVPILPSYVTCRLDV